MKEYLQFVETAASEAEALTMFQWLALQVDFCGGRVLPPGGGKPWRVQAFFDDVPGVGWFPDGVRRVMVMDSQRRAVGLH